MLILNEIDMDIVFSFRLWQNFLQLHACLCVGISCKIPKAIDPDSVKFAPPQSCPAAIEHPPATLFPPHTQAKHHAVKQQQHDFHCKKYALSNSIMLSAATLNRFRQ